MSNDVYAILYLFYGATFMLMGLYALHAYRRAKSVFPTVDAIIYLAVFGLVHGLSEWITMFRYAGLLESYRVELFFFGRILKAISFLALFQFGFTVLFPPRWRKFTLGVLTAYFSLFIAVFYYIVFVRGMNYLYEHPTFLIVSLRYMMALPGSLITVYALWYQGFKVRSLNPVWTRHYLFLGGVFLVYGLLDGLFVRRADFFPANVFYTQWFSDNLGIPIQVLKIMTGIAFYVAVRFVVTSFSWEKHNKMVQIETQEHALRKRGEINQVLHDKLIQSLFVTGLKLEAKLEDLTDNSAKALVGETVENLNENIALIRRIIAQNIDNYITVEALSEELNKLVDTLSTSTKTQIIYKNYLTDQELFRLNKHYNDAIYDTVKELLINATKHSQATTIQCILYQEFNCIKIIIKDNGVGFDIDEVIKEKSIGLKNIQTLVESLEGTMKFRSKRRRFNVTTTTIVVMIPIGGIL